MDSKRPEISSGSVSPQYFVLRIDKNRSLIRMMRFRLFLDKQLNYENIFYINHLLLILKKEET
jgi:hypothetical protein